MSSGLFSYDQVYGELVSQQEVFQDCRHIVDSVLDGYNGTVLAYGQTGSGKTHTLIGSISDPEEHGIVPRAVQALGDGIAADKTNAEYEVRLSVVEIYCERIRDLLDPSRDNLQVKQDAAGSIFIEGVLEAQVGNEAQLVQVMQTGLASRTVAATCMNQQSSRSHCIVTVTVEKTCPDGTMLVGKLKMVDLAGSERQDKTHAVGQTLVEGSQINKSLSALANDSKLTRVLQDSLGGTSRTALIICCSPCVENGPETLSSLRFGSRARGIKNKVTINTRLSPDVLQQQLAKANEKVMAADKEDMSEQQVLQETEMLRQHLDQMKERDQQLTAQAAETAKYKKLWAGHANSLQHLVMPLSELLQRRQAMRQALCPLPEMDPDEWRFVVVLGPPGKGKSSFVKEQLRRLGYPELAEHVVVKALGTGTLDRPAPYILDKHKVLLLDSVGIAAAAPNLLQGEALAADVLLVFLGDGGRSDQLHGDATALAWRLHCHIHICFVVPKADSLLMSRKYKTAEALIVKARQTVGKELHRQLLETDTSVAPRSRNMVLAPDVQILLCKARELEVDCLSFQLLAEPWYSVHCYSCPTQFDDDGSCDTRQYADDDVAAALDSERRILESCLWQPNEMTTKLTSNAGRQGSTSDMLHKPLAALYENMQMVALHRAQHQGKRLSQLLLPLLEKKLQSNQCLLVSELVVLLDSSSSSTQQQALDHLGKLLQSIRGTADDAAEEGAIPRLVRLMDGSQSEQVQLQAALVLQTVTHGHFSRKQEAVEAGVIPVLVRLWADTMPLSLQQQAKHTLISITYQCGAAVAAVAQAGIPTCSSPDDIMLLLKMAAYCGTGDVASKRAVAAAGAIRLFRPWFAHPPSNYSASEVLIELCWAVCNLASDESIKLQLLAEGLQAEVQLLKDHNRLPEVQAAAAQALRHLLTEDVDVYVDCEEEELA
eukprot:gene7717-7916_t